MNLNRRQFIFGVGATIGGIVLADAVQKTGAVYFFEKEVKIHKTYSDSNLFVESMDRVHNEREWFYRRQLFQRTTENPNAVRDYNDKYNNYQISHIPIKTEFFKKDPSFYDVHPIEVDERILNDTSRLERLDGFSSFQEADQFFNDPNNVHKIILTD